MSDSPLVLCVMLAAGRRDMVKRSIACFKQQSYQNRALYILDNGAEPLAMGRGQIKCDGSAPIFVDRLEPGAQRLSIGALRNMANRLSSINVLDAPLIAHWDSDDWYHPDRLQTQIDLLQSNAADVVGFRSALFYDSTKPDGCGAPGAWARGLQSSGEAWIYYCKHPEKCVGSSLLYRREYWERFPFKDVNTGEDTLWQNNRMKRVAIEGFKQVAPAVRHPAVAVLPAVPLMIAMIHGANTCGEVLQGYSEWTRAPQWDDVCRRTMTLEEAPQ